MTVDEIIGATCKIESLLKDCGAIGRGLHEKTTSLESRLSPSIRTELRFIAALRNRAVHDHDHSMDAVTVQRFCRAVEDTTRALEGMSPLSSLRNSVTRLEQENAGLREANENLTKRMSRLQHADDIEWTLKSKREELAGLQKSISEAQSELFRLSREKSAR
jgi:DNA repair exonuclease SbcCD ATPase subunit